MSNSGLVSYSRISPNRTSPRNHVIDTITIHCVVGQWTAKKIADYFSNPARRASCNYGVGCDGNISLVVEEKDRSWCSSNSANDNRAITIEVASDTKHPYAVTEDAMNSLIALLADICKRNNIKELKWQGDKSLVGQVDKQNMTVHRWFAAKACPGDYLYNKHSYIATEVNKLLGTDKKEETTKTEIVDDEQFIYNFFIDKGFTVEGVCGLLGNLFAESGLRSDNLQNSFESKLGYTDEKYVEAVDDKKHNFVRDSAGFGLAQWTYWSRKQALLNYAEYKGVSISDVEMQCEFIMIELLQNYKTVLNVLRTSRDIKEASDCVLTQFERPADMSDKVKNKRYSYSLAFYNKYNKTEQIDKLSDNLKCPFRVRVNISDLNIRTGAGTNYNKTGKYTGVGVFTITEIKQGQGSKKGWGKLKSGVGWISLDYCEVM